MFKKFTKSYWFKSGSLTLLNRLSITMFGLLNFFFLIRILDQDDFGAWVIFLSITGLSESIRNAFIYNPLLRYLNSEDEENHKDIKSASLSLNLFAAFLISTLFVVLAFTVNFFFDAPELKNMLLISIISVFGFTLFAHFTFLQQASLKFGGTVVSTFVQKFVLFAYILYLFITGAETSLFMLALVFSIGYVFSSALAFYFARNERQFTFGFDRVWISKLFHYGKYTLGTNISTMLNKSTKEWFLGSMLGTASVAIFSPAVRVTNLFEIPLAAIASVFYPEMINRVKNEGESAAKYLYERSVAIIMVAILPCVILIFAFAEPIVLIIAGPKYPAAVPVLRIMVLYGLFEPFQRQFGVTLNAIGKAHINFYFIVVSSAIGIVITWVSIKMYGIMGAAYGTILTYALGAAIIQYILYKQINVRTLNIFKYSIQVIKQGAGFVSKIWKNKSLKNG